MVILKGHKQVPGKQPDVTSHTHPSSLHILAYVKLVHLPNHQTEALSTVDWEIFTLKLICMKNFHVIKFLRFHLIRKIFLTYGC